jgi:glycine/D-amino acid oxidase-like deaminating enzyme
LFGGGDVAMFSKANEAADRDASKYRKLLAEMHKSFPFLRETSLSAAWGGPIQTNITELPLL